MTIEEARIFYQEIRKLKKRYGISFSDYHEEERDGEVKFVNITLKAKINPQKKSVDKV